ncbi:hypothetical protein V6N13_001394 [Hibiscus sabdariffa]|uniref:Uncharacterized protein n=1 Tax=Hibiscus sabdariffa TaxID=183260 RepID=A0ABR2G880_9ROSI
MRESSAWISFDGNTEARCDAQEPPSNDRKTIFAGSNAISTSDNLKIKGKAAISEPFYDNVKELKVNLCTDIVVAHANRFSGSCISVVTISSTLVDEECRRFRSDDKTLSQGSMPPPGAFSMFHLRYNSFSKAMGSVLVLGFALSVCLLVLCLHGSVSVACVPRLLSFVKFPMSCVFTCLVLGFSSLRALHLEGRCLYKVVA